MRRHTVETAGHEVANPLPRSRYVPVALGVVAAVALVAVLIATGVVKLSHLSTIVVVLALVTAVTLWVQMHRSDLVTGEERSRLIGFIPMFAASVAFWSVFQQQFTVVALYSDERLNRTFFGYELPPGVVQSLNPSL